MPQEEFLHDLANGPIPQPTNPLGKGNWIGELESATADDLFKMQHLMSDEEFETARKKYIQIQLGRRGRHGISNRIPKIPIKMENIPTFVPGDIVYFKPNIEIQMNQFAESYPCINSTSEIDCKVLELSPGAEGFYNLVSGKGQKYNTVHASSLIPALDRYKYNPAGFLTLKIDTELCRQGTVFELIGEYWSNNILEIYIHISRMAQITSLFE